MINTINIKVDGNLWKLKKALVFIGRGLHVDLILLVHPASDLPGILLSDQSLGS
jgi:hypothetical protein